MTFGLHSNNPRERRAYAHTMLAKARASGETADFEAATAAVHTAGRSRRSRNSLFGASLFNIAVQDPATNTIISQAGPLADPAIALEGVPIDEKPYYFSNRYRVPEKQQPGECIHLASTFRFDMEERRMRLTNLWVEQINRNQSFAREENIPLRDEAVDVVGVRLMPDETRLYMAALINRIISE